MDPDKKQVVACDTMALCAIVEACGKVTSEKLGSEYPITVAQQVLRGKDEGEVPPQVVCFRGGARRRPARKFMNKLCASLFEWYQFGDRDNYPLDRPGALIIINYNSGTVIGIPIVVNRKLSCETILSIDEDAIAERMVNIAAEYLSDASVRATVVLTELRNEHVAIGDIP